MSEQPPRPENQEFSEEERALIEAMGNIPEAEFSKSEAQKLLVKWLQEREKESDRFATSGERIKDQLKLAKIYRAAGYNEAAVDTLRPLLEVSDADARDSYNEVVEMLDELES